MPSTLPDPAVVAPRPAGRTAARLDRVRPVSRLRRISAAVGLVVAWCLLAACGSSAPATETGSRAGAAVPAGLDVAGVDAAVVVSGGTANTPRPELSPMATAVLEGVLAAGRPVSVVRVAGTPTLADDLGLRELGGTAAGNAKVARGNLAKITRAMAVPPGTDGADYLAGILMAVDVARGSGATHPLIIVVGSGLSDTGAWQFTAPGMLGAEPGEVVASLGDAVTADRLTGAVVLLSGVGWTVAPQESLGDALRGRVQALWSGVLQAMGAGVVVDPQPFTQDSVATSHAVRPVELPATIVEPDEPVVACAPREVVLDQTGDVSFVADSDELIDPQAADGAVHRLAELILADDSVTVSLRGTTADVGDLGAQQDLGLRRALVVRDALVAAGVPSGRFAQVVGVGSDFPEYVRPDRDSAGVLLPGPSALNRSVRATLTYDC